MIGEPTCHSCKFPIQDQRHGYRHLQSKKQEKRKREYKDKNKTKIITSQQQKKVPLFGGTDFTRS